MIRKLYSLGIFFLILFLGTASALYSMPSQNSSSASQASPYFTPMPSPVLRSSPSLVSSQPRYPAQQSAKTFNRDLGFWDRAFAKQDVFYDNINRAGFCPRGKLNFERCQAYPVFDYPFYQQPRSGSGGLRFWR